MSGMRCGADTIVANSLRCRAVIPLELDFLIRTEASANWAVLALRVMYRDGPGACMLT